MVWWNDLHSYCLSAWVFIWKKWKILCKAPLWYAKVLLKPYDDISWRPYTLMLLVLHWALSNCCDPWENSFHTFKIKIHVHTTYPLLCFYEKLALYHPSIPQNKSSIVCVGLPLQLLLKKRRESMGYQKKLWTHEGPSVEKKEKKIYGHMMVHEKKRKKR